MSSLPSVSVIIPTRNRPGPLARLLTSVVEARGVSEIIVVDDGSDPPVDVNNPAIRVIRNDHSQFLSAARNRGAAEATSEILLFVDDDCVIARETPTLLARALLADSGAGVAGPVITYLSEPNTIWCAGVTRARWTGRTKFPGRGQPLHAAQALPAQSEDFPSAFAVRRAAFESVGGFNEERFEMHMGEAEFCERIRRRGLHVTMVHGAVVAHDIEPNSSLARQLHVPNVDRAFLVARNRVLYVRALGLPPLQRTTQLVFWLLVLLPAHLGGVVIDQDRPFRERLRMMSALVRGSIEGLVGSRPSMRLSGASK